MLSVLDVKHSLSAAMRLILVMYLCGAARLVTAQLPERPSPSIPAVDNSWQYFCESGHKLSVSDKLKCIKLGKQNEISFSGQLRNRGEHFDHTILGANSPSTDYLLQRYMLSSDLSLGEHVRFFSTLESGLENWRIGGPRISIDEDRLFVHESFLQFRTRREHAGIDLRVGRQDLTYGAGRLIGTRELPNVHFNFDGVRLIASTGLWQVSLLAMRPSINAPGVFDDVPDHTASLWGIYATRNYSKASLDLYYLGTDRKSATFQTGSGREQRQTLGTRFAGASGGWDHDSEFVFQFGTFAKRPIAAWTATTYTGYTLNHRSVGTLYRIAIDTGIASGNGNPKSGTFGTFNALFPRGAYFGYANFIGPYNVDVIRPSLRVTIPSRHVTIWPNAEWLWRQNKNDGIYSIPAVLIQRGSPQEARYVGLQMDLNVTWEQSPHISWNVDGAHLFAGRFLYQSAAGKSVNYFAPGVTYKF